MYIVVMHIVINKSKQGKKIFSSTLLMESYREDGKVKKRTIANFSNCSADEVEAMRLALKYKKDLTKIGKINLKGGKSVGATWVVAQIAKQLGIENALGDSANGKMAMTQIIMRVINQGSRLSCARLADFYSIGDILGIRDGFTEDDLYRNLKWITENQADIEDKLWANRKGKKAGIFLYDVTSSYFEGNDNELAEYGYNRDKKKGKKQVVAGLLCDSDGVPISIELFRGNTTDVQTFGNQVHKIAKRFGCDSVTIVGDKGMIKETGINTLKTEGFHYITTITKPQIEGLIKTGYIQLGLFDIDLCEVTCGEIRYIFRRNPFRAAEIAQCRFEKKEVLIKLINKKNVYLKTHLKSKTDIAIKEITNKINSFHLNKWLSINLFEREIQLIENEEALLEISKLDGCYSMKTDLGNDIDKEIIHDRYKDLAEVEWAFRTCKTGLLELRPIYTQTEESTRGHALIVMLSYMIIQQLRKLWKEFDLTVEEGIKKLTTVTSTAIWINNKLSSYQIPAPIDELQKLLDPLGVVLPEILPCLGAKIVTRKKLQKTRKTL